MRLDQYLVERGQFETRARARDAILRGTIEVDGHPAKKPSQNVAEGCLVVINDPAQTYVSRSALKLKEGLKIFELSPKDQICVDLGASTGGFTQVLLEQGARRVHAIDVGHDQLHASLAADPRVNQRDGVNARILTLADLENQSPTFLVSDISFISLRLALPPALELAKAGTQGVFLIKPQFEAGREAIGKGGIVKPEIGTRVAEDLYTWFEEQPGWRVMGMIPSPILGGDGNREFLLAACKDR
ncbi:TlyA family RNA methyltransferase [Pseudovibrio sp. SPO723]|uniref:TlyA family RNA methyltransferase n=1 Tax=Nesiotobacter zosterae TaxID=392721 RepID=UPI0029C11336|nr:TlyA family RNA methyltransferase [Pseudovibrio sp. SPO723]MDX5593118.1 TlyA family RNA methyltransferase [Pseudovibrio sp. SPO723]